MRAEGAEAKKKFNQAGQRSLEGIRAFDFSKITLCNSVISKALTL